MQAKPKWEITKITVSQNIKRIYGKLNGQLSPKRWPLSYLSLTKYHLDTQKVKTVQKLLAMMMRYIYIHNVSMTVCVQDWLLI